MPLREEPFARLIRKLGALAPLNEADQDALRQLPMIVTVEPSGSHLVREGSQPSDCCVLLSGFACRYKVNATGGRQIVSFQLPGDILDLQHLHLPRADHHVQTISTAQIAWIPRSKLRSLADERPSIAKALWRDALIDASIFREWVLNVGRRNAQTRIAHMLCEFVARAEAAGLGPAEGFVLPITQDEIADATGMTPVHVNRSMKALRLAGVFKRSAQGDFVKDWPGLKRIGEFDQAYLHALAA